MKLSTSLATLAMSTALSLSAHAAVVLAEQAPHLLANAVANGTDGQAPRLAESITWQGTATQLSWWGTAAAGFDIVVALDGQDTPLLNTQVVDAEAWGTTIDIDGQPSEVFRYSVNVGQLPAGRYALSVLETGMDAQGGSWYWLQSAVGDGTSVSGFGDRARSSNAFDLSLQARGDAGTVPEPATAALLAGALAALQLRRRPSV